MPRDVRCLRLSGSTSTQQLQENPESQSLVADEQEENRNKMLLRIERDHTYLSTTRAFLIRTLALLCTCCLSIGSHYGTNILGPLKSRLLREMGISNTEFSLLISALSLNTTWTPLVGGLMASRLGTTYTSILATGAIFLGQILLLIGEFTEDVRLMVFGLFIFGLGIGPLNVTQETIIVRFFGNHGLGVPMALGLVGGKGASFISARTSYPLSERYGRHAPFYVATSLAGLSVIVNLVYVSASKWFIRNTGTRLEASEIYTEARDVSLSLSEAQALEAVAERKKIKLGEITRLDLVFWTYIGVNVLCGTIWAPLLQLSANIFQQRYQLSELDAGTYASNLLVGSVILYPVCGFIVDRFKRRPIAIQLLLFSSLLQFLCYLWLVLPPTWTRTPVPGVMLFATGLGFSQLLLVIVVPQLVPMKYVSTTLGAHKSLEQSGTVIMQTLSGLILDNKYKGSLEERAPDTPSGGESRAIQRLLNTFLCLNVVHFVALVTLAHLDRRKKAAATSAPSGHGSLGISDDLDEDQPSSPESPGHVRGVEGLLTSTRRRYSTTSREQTSLLSNPRTSYYTRNLSEPDRGTQVHLPKPMEVRRGEFFACLSAALVVFAWVLFLVTAWLRLRSKVERGGAAVDIFALTTN